MAQQVFISYARAASAGQAQALADRLGELAFFDTEAIDDGDHFPERLLDGVLDARIVVIFATKTYVQRRFCRLEMKLALAGGPSHVVVAIEDGANALLDAMPAGIANQSWPAAGETDRLDALVRERLNATPQAIRAQLARDEARAIAAVFREESQIPEPQPLPKNCSMPAGIAAQSLGNKFVGRAEDLRAIHRALLVDGAQQTARIAAGGGFGKTRLAVEYFHRYGRVHYPGGLFWVNAAASDLEGEFYRILRTLVPDLPELAVMRAQKRDIRHELGQALRAIGKPTLYVVDDIPEAPAGQTPPAMSEFCPALGAVTVLATSRQKTMETGVKIITLDTLAPEAATLLLTEDLSDLSALSWSEWGAVAQWVGYLPLALELLNRALALDSIPARGLLQRSMADGGGAAELDRLADALREQVPAGALRGITEALKISYDKLDQAAAGAALMLAQLAPAPIPNEFIDALPDPLKTPAVRAALRSRNFVTGGGGLVYGVMHGLTADFLRSNNAGYEAEVLKGACQTLLKLMDGNRIRDARQWNVINLCRPHAEALLARGVQWRESAAYATEVGVRAEILAAEQGRYANAKEIGEFVLGIRRQLYGPDHPETLKMMNNLTIALGRLGDHAGERKLEEQLVKGVARLFGDEDERTLTLMNNLAETMREQGDVAGAIALHQKIFDIRKRVLGEEDPDTLTSRNNLALTKAQSGDLKGARDDYERVFYIRTRILGDEHLDTLMSKNNLGVALIRVGETTPGRTLLTKCLEARRRLLGEDHPDTRSTRESLRKLDEAIAAGVVKP